MSSRDLLYVEVGRLDETQLRQLRDVAARMSVEAGMEPWIQSWYTNVAKALTAKLADRNWEWLDVVSDPAVPPDWDTAVAALGDDPVS